MAGVVDGGRADAADGTDDAAEQRAESERESCARHVGCGSRCSAARYAHASADSGGGAGGDAVRGHLPVGLHAAQDFARNAASRETVDSDELVRERAQAVGGHGRECGLGVLKRLVARLDEADL